VLRSSPLQLLALVCPLAVLVAYPAVARSQDEESATTDAPAATPEPEASPSGDEPAPEQPQPQPPPDEILVPPVPPPAVPVPEPAPPRPESVFSGRPHRDDVVLDDEERSWFDSGHDLVGRIFFAPAVRIDRFFSDETDLDPVRAESFARIRTALRLREDGEPDLAAEVLANIRLPGVNRWLGRTRIVFSGSSDTFDETSEIDGSPLPTVSRDRRAANLELRYGAHRGIRSTVDLGAGVMFRLPVGAFTRVRYRLAVPIEDRLLGRFSTQVFWRTDLHLGTRVTAGLEWPATASSLVRLAGSGRVAQRRTRGVEYGTELVYSYAFTPRSAIALGTDAQGNTDVPVVMEKYRLYTRFRQDVLRRWLFFELEPEIGWPWKPERGRYRAYAVTFRLEVQLEGDRAVADTR
jgi:hypothetical protein